MITLNLNKLCFLPCIPLKCTCVPQHGTQGRLCLRPRGRDWAVWERPIASVPVVCLSLSLSLWCTAVVVTTARVWLSEVLHVINYLSCWFWSTPFGEYLIRCGSFYLPRVVASFPSYLGSTPVSACPTRWILSVVSIPLKFGCIDRLTLKLRNDNA